MEPVLNDWTVPPSFAGEDDAALVGQPRARPAALADNNEVASFRRAPVTAYVPLDEVET